MKHLLYVSVLPESQASPVLPSGQRHSKLPSGAGEHSAFSPQGALLQPASSCWSTSEEELDILLPSSGWLCVE